MDFEFSDEQEQLRDAVRRWVDKGFGFERRHALAKAGGLRQPAWISGSTLSVDMLASEAMVMAAVCCAEDNAIEVLREM